MGIVRFNTGPAEIPGEVWATLPEATKIGLESLTPGERLVWWTQYKQELESASREPVVWPSEED